MGKKYLYTLFFYVFCLGISNSLQGLNLYTPNGHIVSAFTQAEALSITEKAAYNSWVINTYPNVTLLADATTTYNCHSYAWNMSEGGSTCWLNQSPDLHWYWDDGSYVETSEAMAEKIFYYSGDHSAIKSKTHSGMYESKWGSWGLVRHAPEDGPATYQMTKRRYYKLVVKIKGPSMVGGTSTASYTVNRVPSNLTWLYDTNLLTLVSSSSRGITVKPKTSTTVGDATIVARYTDATGSLQSAYYYVGVNGPHWRNVNLIVKRSSDGKEAYPSGGLCPNTYYYAQLETPGTTLTDVNWGASSQLQVSSASNNQLYFRTSSEGWGVLNITARTSYGVTKSILNVTLTGGGDCGNNYSYYSISSSSNVINIEFDLGLLKAGINEGIKTKKSSFTIRMYSIIGVLVKEAYSSGENVRIDTSSLQNGTYIIHVYDGINEHPSVERLLIKH